MIFLVISLVLLLTGLTLMIRARDLAGVMFGIFGLGFVIAIYVLFYL